MTLEDLMTCIESIAFATRYTPLSGFSSVLAMLKHDETICELIVSLQQAETKSVIYDHLLQLLPANPHPDYAHPLDEAITAYLYALNQVNAGLAQQAAIATLATPRLWWAKRMAEHLHTAQPETINPV